MKALISTSLFIFIATAAFVSAQDRIRRHEADLCAKPVDAAAATPAPAAAPAAKPSASTEDPAQIAAAFFSLLEKSRVEEAYTNLTRGSKIADRPDEMKALKTKTTEAISVFGTMDGYDLVETKSVGPHLMRRTYLSLGKEFPLRWRFYFYRADDRWRLVDLRVDDRLTGIFDEAEPVDADQSQKDSSTHFDQGSR